MKTQQGYRDIINPSLRSLLDLAATVEFPERATLLPSLTRQFDTLKALQTESIAAIAQPKASRRAALGKEYADAATTLLQTLEKLVTQLSAAVNHVDPVVDQLLAIKQIAWLVRDTGGQAAVLISQGFNAGRLPPEARQTYTKFTIGTEYAWKALETMVAGTQLPAGLVEAMAATKKAYFEPQNLAYSERVLTALIAGEKPEVTSAQWSPDAIGRLGVAVKLAERALDEAKAHATTQWSSARQSLILNVTLLAAALVLAIGSMMVVGRRVITPLHAIRDGMLKVAAGDLSVDAGYAERHDEIGSLAGALATFKQQAVEKMRIEQQERERNAGAATRQQAVESYIGEFETHVRGTLQQLGDASSQMRTTSDGMSEVSTQTNASVQIAAKASSEASMNVQSVASAAEELSASINDIRRQAAHAAGIAGRAVSQARATDSTVQGLAKTASRIGEVVGLINDIAVADQPAGAQRHHRGRARRRGRPRLCGGRVRGQIAGQPDRQGDRGYFGADRRHAEGRQRGDRSDQGDRRHHRRSQRGRHRDRRGRRRAGRRHPGDHPQHPAGGAGHQERVRQHHRRQRRRRCRRRGGTERQDRLGDAGRPDPAVARPGRRLPRQDPRGVTQSIHAPSSPRI